MKKTGIIILLGLALYACSYMRPEGESEPEVYENVSLVKVSIEPFTLTQTDNGQPVPGEGVHHWSASERLGIIGSNTANTAFLLVKDYDGKAGREAEFYGEPVSGSNLTAYLPWNEGGMPGAGGIQEYYADPYLHFMNNSLLSGKLSGDRLSLSYKGGLLKLTCNEDIGKVESVSIVCAGWSASVQHINMTCGPSTPLTVWVNIPSGDYHNFSVSYICTGSSVSIPASITVTVKDFDCVSVVASQQPFSDGIEDFHGQDGSYDDPPTDY